MRIPLTAGQFIRLEVMQTGVDLIVSFRDPLVHSVADVDSGNGRYGPETVVAIAEVAGEYTLEVKGNDPRNELNEYTITVVELRDAVPADRETVAACRNYAEAEKLIGARTAEASQQAIARFALAHDYFSQSGERYMDGLATFGLGIAFGQTGAFRKAVSWYEEAAASFRAAADPHMEKYALNNQGGTLDVLGEPAQALKLYERALELFQVAGDRAFEALVLNNAGAIEAQLSEWQSALEHYRQALPLFREAGDRRNEGRVLRNMGVAYQQLGRTEEALRFFGQALPLRRAASDRSGEAATLTALANAHLSQQEPAQALVYLKDALALWRTLGDRRGEGDTLRIQGQALTGLDRPSFFTMHKSRADQVEEEITVLLTPKPLEGFEIGPAALALPSEQVAGWEKQWKGKAEVFELAGGAGKAWTAAEQRVAADSTRLLTQDDPAPQTVYRVETGPGDPMLITVRLRYR